MLTWAIAWFSVKTEHYNGLWFMISMGCDVAIFYYIALAVTEFRR